MANPINLHELKYDFNILIKETADFFNIREVFIEKDYWITSVLKRLAKSKYVDKVVFKGGTSLSKGYKLIDRFSEDVDIAIINIPGMTGNQLKTLIRNVEKTISVDLNEIDDPLITSKGSRYRKSIFTYQGSDDKKTYQGISKRLIIEINSFANPNPFVHREIKSLIAEFLESSGRNDLIERYDLQAFNLNILDKSRTLTEKIVALIRFSFSEDPIVSLSGKIRHFYDIYFLLKDSQCRRFFDSETFSSDVIELIKHDRLALNEPPGWDQKTISLSPLINDFDMIWGNIKAVYVSELSNLAFSRIPDEKEVLFSFNEIVRKLSTIPI